MDTPPSDRPTMPRASPDYDPAKVARRTWEDAKALWVPCPDPHCDLKHDYESWLDSHGFGDPPLHLGRLVRPVLRADRRYQAWLQGQTRAARRERLHRNRAA